MDTLSTPDADPVLLREAERVRASGLLGESRLRDLFDYLVDKSAAGHSPKEIEIAIDVFGKTGDFDVSQDALVRVYIHKLRRALERVYSQASGADVEELQIQRGEYRLRVKPKAVVPLPRTRAMRPAWMGIALGSALCIALTLLWIRSPRSDLDLVRASPVWASILRDERPILLIVGDYYLIGETDSSMEVKRLVREFPVHSKSALDDYVQQHPEAAEHYMDVGIRYLPTAVAFALRDVMAVLAPANRRVSVNLMSNVQPGSFKSADIIYIGYFSGMGMLQDLVFSGSRFSVGASFDELFDKIGKHTYTSQTAERFINVPPSSNGNAPYRDYGYFSTLLGPGGNTLMVISGTRDEGVRQIAEAFTNPVKLDELQQHTNLATPFETLLEVNALDGVNMTGKLLIQSKR